MIVFDGSDDVEHQMMVNGILPLLMFAWANSDVYLHLILPSFASLALHYDLHESSSRHHRDPRKEGWELIKMTHQLLWG